MGQLFYGWIVDLPPTVLPTTSTVPPSGIEPVLPVTVKGPVTVFPSNSTPPKLPLMVAGPLIVFPAQAGSEGLTSSSPTRTSDVVPPIVRPATVDPHMRIATAPEEVSWLPVVAPSMSSAPPGCTLSGPLTTAPGAIKTDWPESTVTDATLPEMVME